MQRFIIGLLLVAHCYATALTGTINGPDGTGANGYLYFQLAQQGALSAAGSCGGPIEILPTIQVQIQVISGAMQMPPSIYGNDCILPQGTFYNVTFKDNNGNLLFSDRWQLSGSSIDVGTIVSVVITGTTQSLGSAGVLLTQPTGAQTITQPPSTDLSINDLVVTDAFTAVGGFACSAESGECVFEAVSAFVNGFGTGASSNSTIYIGSGNLYTRALTGGGAICTGVANGWFAIRTDEPEILFCINGNAYSVPLTQGQAP